MEVEVNVSRDAIGDWDSPYGLYEFDVWTCGICGGENLREEDDWSDVGPTEGGFFDPVHGSSRDEYGWPKDDYAPLDTITMDAKHRIYLRNAFGP